MQSFTDPAPSHVPEPAAAPAEHFAGFWLRSVASTIDSLLLYVAAIIAALGVLGAVFWIRPLWSAGGSASSWSMEDFNAFLFQLLVMGLYLVLSVPYYVWGQYRYGTTLGKRLCHIYVVSYPEMNPITLGQSLGRFLASFLSALPLYTGYLMVLFQPQKRALHDLIAGTVSVIRPKEKKLV